MAQVVLLFKADDKKLTSNYRSNSILRNLSEIFEKTIDKRLIFILKIYQYFKTISTDSEKKRLKTTSNFSVETITSEFESQNENKLFLTSEKGLTL